MAIGGTRIAKGRPPASKITAVSPPCVRGYHAKQVADPRRTQNRASGALRRRPNPGLSFQINVPNFPAATVSMLIGAILGPERAVLACAGPGAIYAAVLAAAPFVVVEVAATTSALRPLSHPCGERAWKRTGLRTLKAWRNTMCSRDLGQLTSRADTLTYKSFEGRIAAHYECTNQASRARSDDHLGERC